MMSLTTFLEHSNDNYYLIRDEKGNIIYPKSKEDLEIFSKILDSYYDDRLYIYGNKYYEHSSQIMKENDNIYVVEILENVTRFKEESILANTDYVTNLSNKRLTYETFNNFISKSIEYKTPFACVSCDADLFKRINDDYGHFCGDLMLKSMGSVLYENTRHRLLKGKFPCRGLDIVGRVGGEEFLIVLNNVNNILNAYNVANKIRSKIENSNISYKGKVIDSCTMSFGIYFVSKEELEFYGNNSDTIDEIRDEIIEKSDEALYTSKRNGRNQVNIYDIDVKDKDIILERSRKQCIL